MSTEVRSYEIPKGWKMMKQEQKNIKSIISRKSSNMATLTGVFIFRKKENEILDPDKDAIFTPSLII